MAGAAVAWGVARAHRRDNEVVPGVPTSAPASWAGAHTAEARLHRRLRDAARAAQAADPHLRTLVEREALAVDEGLVAIAALPERVRAGHLPRLTAAVESLEEAAAAAVAGAAEARDGGRATALEEVRERLRLLAEARAELDLRPPPRRADEGGTLPGTGSS